MMERDEVVSRVGTCIEAICYQMGISKEEYIDLLWVLLISWYQEEEIESVGYERYIERVVGRMVKDLVNKCR